MGKNSDSNIKYHQRCNTQSRRLTTNQIQILCTGLFSNNVNGVSVALSFVHCKCALKICVELTHIMSIPLKKL